MEWSVELVYGKTASVEGIEFFYVKIERAVVVVNSGINLGVDGVVSQITGIEFFRNGLRVSLFPIKKNEAAFLDFNPKKV